jgi:lipopolysaccharide/colanic/teichoic acid biosynthesis glycosyltransferase
VPSEPARFSLTKRALDLGGALVGMVLSSPLVAISALAIRLEDGGPVVYSRRVVGLNGIEFNAFKLRTMRVDADAWLEKRPELLAQYHMNVKLRRDPRVTRVGRVLRSLSLDELPQLVNVLRGEMSLVGPRMIHPSELVRYGEFGPQRLSVKPGITGLWQVSGRQSTSYAERIELDARYIRERSLLLDLRILLKTLPAVLSRGGAH